MSELLQKAICYERNEAEKIEEKSRPLFHLASRVGWMNDPNGFSYYGGKYHLFYQYYPYDTQWGPMHWGHAVSGDLIKWTYLPAALAPDMEYDRAGCFSGSAIELPTGEQLLMYTGVEKEELQNGESKEFQRQCVAIGDGTNYRKYDWNPVLTEKDLPADSSPYDFRDPKIWYDAGVFYCVAGNCTRERDGRILLFRSGDGVKWQFEKVLIQNNGRFGKMWECPDFFALDGKQVLITSPQEMLPAGLEFHNGNGTLYITGSYDGEHNFREETYGAIDHGIDFYAPQTAIAPDGRRIMAGWMQNWDTQALKPDFKWFGQMSVPRELRIENGKLIQNPVREIEKYYGQRIAHRGILFSEELTLSGVEGRCIDMTVEICPEDNGEMYKKWEIRFADNGTNYSSVIYDPYESIIKLDRKHSGTRRATIHQRRAYVRNRKGRIKLRFILDRFSMEVFVNDGEQALTMTFYTDIDAERIRFLADGKVSMDVVMNKLELD